MIQLQFLHHCILVVIVVASSPLDLELYPED